MKNLHGENPIESLNHELDEETIVSQTDCKLQSLGKNPAWLQTSSILSLHESSALCIHPSLFGQQPLMKLVTQAEQLFQQLEYDRGTT